MLTGSPPIVVEDAASEVGDSVSIPDAIDVGEWDEIKIKDSLHWFELDAVHQIVYHALYYERSIYIWPSHSAEDDYASIVVLRDECMVDRREVDRPSFFFEETFAGHWGDLNGLSS